MRVLMVSGIFPLDHGGPASYAPRSAEALTEGFLAAGAGATTAAPRAFSEAAP
jgi:hypothetical protein